MAVIASNESLTQTKLDPNIVFTPSSYPDNKSVIGAFKRAVQMTLEDSDERAALFGALKKFHASMIVEELMDDLKVILDGPEKRILYKYISPLIPHRLRNEYRTLVPHIPSFEKKIVRLKQQGNHPYGFSVRGGKEFSCGIFVTNVIKSSRSAQAGLMVGDQIMRVNGLIVSECTHEEFINLVKLKRTLTLNVKAVGLVPEKKLGSNKMTWKSVGEKRGWQSNKRIGIHGPIQSTKRIHVTLQGNEPLGTSIKTSTALDGGILIIDVMPNSAADNAGLKRGDEILEVNGVSLVGRTMNEASKFLRSNKTLMLTIRVDEGSNTKTSHSFESISAELEFGPSDFDIDAETVSPKLEGRKRHHHEETGFILQTRFEPLKSKKPVAKNTSSSARIPVIDSEVEQSKILPSIASPAAIGHGPALAMPTILELAQKMPSGFRDDGLDQSFSSSIQTTPVKKDVQTTPIKKELSLSPVSPPTPIPLIGRATVEGTSDTTQDLSMYQFPDEDEETDVPLKQTSQSAMKKENRSNKRVHKPSFSENVQIIPRDGWMSNSNSIDNFNLSTGIHPSNLSFSQEILQGRKVQFHTIPKDGPLRLAIRGGVDTPLGSQIIISRIIEGGSAHSYGKLNVGDQVLVCDGVSLIDVTHDEAGQAFKRAMDLDSPSIDLVVAVNPDIASSVTPGGGDTIH